METRRSLEQLDGQVWGEPPPDATGLVVSVHRLRRIPLAELSDDDLRLLLGQKVGVDWLIPIALTRPEANPMAGDLYPGDLLRAVLRAGTEYWPTHSDEVMHLWAVRESLEKLRSDATDLLAQSDWPAFG